VLLIFLPLPRSAFASRSSTLFSKKETHSGDTNSQTVALLRAALSLSSKPTGGGDITIVDDSALLPSGPSGAGSTALDERSPDEISIYVVRAKGDSLSGIAKMFGVTPSTIIWANDIQRGVLTEGQKLVILRSRASKYTVKEGDTIKKNHRQIQS